LVTEERDDWFTSLTKTDIREAQENDEETRRIKDLLAGKRSHSRRRGERPRDIERYELKDDVVYRTGSARGEAATRLLVPKSLQKRSTGRTIYILDEPTTGLHFDDIRKLLNVISGLVDKGNTVIVIEHNLDVIKTSDWIVDMGPEGGSGGGVVIAEGTPEDVAGDESSYTGQYLRRLVAPNLASVAG